MPNRGRGRGRAAGRQGRGTTGRGGRGRVGRGRGRSRRSSTDDDNDNFVPPPGVVEIPRSTRTTRSSARAAAQAAQVDVSAPEPPPSPAPPRQVPEALSSALPLDDDDEFPLPDNESFTDDEQKQGDESNADEDVDAATVGFALLGISVGESEADAESTITDPNPRAAGNGGGGGGGDDPSSSDDGGNDDDGDDDYASNYSASSEDNAEDGRPKQDEFVRALITCDDSTLDEFSGGEEEEDEWYADDEKHEYFRTNEEICLANEGGDDQPKAQDWEDVDLVSYDMFSVRFEYARREIQKRAKKEIDAIESRMDELLRSRSQLDIARYIFGSSSDLCQLFCSNLSIDDKTFYKFMSTFFKACEWSSPAARLVMSNEFNSSNLLDMPTYNRIWREIASFDVGRQGNQFLWEKLEKRLNDFLQTMFLSGAELPQYTVAIDDDKIHFQWTKAQLESNPNYLCNAAGCQHVRDNRKGTTAHTAATPCSQVPYYLRVQRHDETVVDSYKKVVEGMFQHRKQGGRSEQYLQNVTLH